MALTDFQKILEEYKITDDDFGFSALSEEEHNARITSSTQTAEDYKRRLADLEKLIVPFLQKLHTTGEKEYIYWPNRKPVLEEQLQKVLKLTRG